MRQSGEAIWDEHKCECSGKKFMYGKIWGDAFAGFFKVVPVRGKDFFVEAEIGMKSTYECGLGNHGRWDFQEKSWIGDREPDIVEFSPDGRDAQGGDEDDLFRTLCGQL